MARKPFQQTHDPCDRRAFLSNAVASAGLFTLAGCQSFLFSRKSLSKLPDAHLLVREQLIVHSESALPMKHRLIDDLISQRLELFEKLSLAPSDEPIHVYLFDAPERYETYVEQHYPGLPARRAFFVETDTKLAVFAHWGDRVAEDLRHEVTHGYLHSSIRNLPLWLDEGIAEFFETPRGKAGFNAPHAQLLRQRSASGAWAPDLVRLENLNDAVAMSQQDYAEAWLWTHFLMETTPERLTILREYLHDLRTGRSQPLSVRLNAGENSPYQQALQEHLARLPRGE